MLTTVLTLLTLAVPIFLLVNRKRLVLFGWLDIDHSIVLVNCFTKKKRVVNGPGRYQQFFEDPVSVKWTRNQGGSTLNSYRIPTYTVFHNLNGAVFSSNVVNPVRAVTVHDPWESIEGVFELWKQEGRNNLTTLTRRAEEYGLAISYTTRETK